MTPYEIPELFPRPKSISLLDGMTELSVDVRLITANVYPLQRKSIRAILAEAGVRVIANKKTYIIEARIEEDGEFNFAGVPESCRSDYYEITLNGSEVLIRAQQQRGAVMAACTLASLYRMFINGTQLPNLFIRDWPDMPVRGVMIDTAWGTDRMNLAEWMRTIDQLTVLKFNALGIGIYNCMPESRFEDNGNPAEFFAFPMPERDELKVTHSLSWYSAEKDVWNNDTYQASTVEKEELLGDVLAYAKEKDMMVFPIFSLFGNNTLFPRVMPETSALDENNKPSEKSFCTYSRDTRVFVTELISSFMEKYYPEGAPFVHVKMDDIHEFCGCSKCRMAGHDELASDYLLWLTKTLVARNVGKVVFWQDAMVRNPRAMESIFARKLFTAGLKDRAVIHWRETANGLSDKKNRPALGKKTGISSWVGPIVCDGCWSLYESKHNSIKDVMDIAMEDKVQGVVGYDLYDPAHIDQVGALANYAWNGPKEMTPQNVLQHWAMAHYGENAQHFENVINTLSKLSATDTMQACIYSKYAVAGGEPYPQAALEKLEAMDGSVEKLNDILMTAQQLIEEINELAATEHLRDVDTFCLKSLRAEAARICALAEAFAWMLELRQELEAGMIMKRMNTSALKARDALCARMKMVERNKQNYLTPAVMHPLSKLLEFIEQLTEELKARAARKQAKLICWHLK